MRVLVTGASGMLGSQVLRDVPNGNEAVGCDRADADLAEPAQVEDLLAARGPFDGVIHCAGFADVDGAEEREEQALRDNAGTTAALAATGLRLLVVSSDYVFDGRADRPYREEDPPAPLGAYGRTKLAAERAAGGALIVRTQWLYGPCGRHFPGRILEMARSQSEISVVADQTGCPTSTAELAPALWDVLAHGEPGLYHAACEGSCTWFELAVAVLEDAGLNGVDIVPCRTGDLPRPAPRPAYSALDCAKLAALRGRRLAHWREALRRYVAASSQ